MFPGMKGDKSSYQLIMDQMKSEYANPYQRYNAMSRLTGVSMPAAEAMEGLGSSNFGTLSKMLGKLGIEAKDLTPTSIQDLAKLSRVKGDGLGAARADLLKRGDLTDMQKTELEKAGPGDALRKVMAQIYMKLGRETNDGTKILDATTRMANALTNDGSHLLAPIYAIRNAVAGGANLADEMISAPPIAHGMAGGPNGVTALVNDSYKRKRERDMAVQGDAYYPAALKIEHSPLIVKHEDSNGHNIKTETMPAPIVTPSAL